MKLCEDCEKSECIISELEDNFEWIITCVTKKKKKKKKQPQGKKQEKKNRLDEIMAEMFPV